MSHWIEICRAEDLQADSGICARLAGKQIALFFLPRLNAVFAIGNRDPFSQANVLSRGMVGDIGGEPMVASPMYKQHFSLRSGICLEDAAVRVPVFQARIEQGRVEVSSAAD